MYLRAYALIVVVVLCACSRPASGAILSYEVDNPVYALQPGQSVVVPVYLRETACDGVSLLQAEDGLRSVGALLRRTGSSAPMPVAIVGVTANIAQFSDLPPTISFSDRAANLFEMTPLASGQGVLEPETSPGSGIRRILIGEFTLQACSLGTTTFQVSDGPSDDTVTWSRWMLLDPQIYATSFQVDVVPEPSVAVLLTVGAATVLIRRHRQVS